MTNPWKHISEITPKVETYIDKRRKGLIKSLRSGFHKLDAANIDGFEWGSTVTIGGRPSVGKSIFSELMVRGFFNNNEPDFDLLDFSWEMSPEVIIKRNLSTDFQRSYKYMCSADRNKITDIEMESVSNLLQEKYAVLPIYYVEKPDTPAGFAETVRKFRDWTKRKLVVRVDHTILARISQYDGDRVTMLLNLLGKANEIKKESEVIFVFLTQLNREFEQRQESRTNRAFPQQSDTFGGDAAAMYSETMILLNKPAKYNINWYGDPKTGIEVNPHDLFAHIVKSRNSEPNLIVRYREEFTNMSMEEI